MSKSLAEDARTSTSSSLQSCSHPYSVQSISHSGIRHSDESVFRLLAWREISPRAKRVPKSLWKETSKRRTNCFGLKSEVTDAKGALISWVEAESFRHLSAEYCPLLPPPRSTIAAAFSYDGKTLASTHGDHTVKIIDCLTGSCLKVLSGHRRTPWVVRFHPLYPEILASGSLDHEVRLWDANTADCIGSRDFYRPIASIAFHAQGDLLAVASGHKLYIWNYNRQGEANSPTIVLKTRRSLRAVHFHPHAAPLLLTAEVNDLDSPDTPLTLATTSGYLQYPPPALFFASANPSEPTPLVPSVPLWQAFLRDGGAFSQNETEINESSNTERGESSLTFRRQAQVNAGIPYSNEPIPMEMSHTETSNVNHASEEENSNCLSAEVEPINPDSFMDSSEAYAREFNRRTTQISSSTDASNAPLPAINLSGVTSHIPIRQSMLRHGVTPGFHPSSSLGMAELQMLLRRMDARQLHQFVPSGDPSCWELPFLQGWLMGQTHAMLPGHSLVEDASGIRGMLTDVLISDALPPRHRESSSTASDEGTSLGQSRGATRSRLARTSRHNIVASRVSGETISQSNVPRNVADTRPGATATNIEAEIANTISSDSSTDLPCTVKLRIWPHDVHNPSLPLDPEKCRLIIPHAVLCSEMGAHFSPCGRFLAACVACVLPHMEVEPGLISQSHQDITESATSPTRHPISGHRIIYELRIYSLEEATFGSILVSRAIRAAHCLTSIQFSPTSDHILLAYGRRHGSLLRSYVTDGEMKMHIYTILEVYRISDMELVRVLPSAEDEVNVACFHPLAGCGLVYGTKEGKLRILNFDGRKGRNCTESNLFLQENMLEIQQYAPEG